MRRRLVWIQGAIPVAPALKILLERNDGINEGYYVGGWSETPVFVAPFGNDAYPQIRLSGITATGPGVDDWIASGWGFDGSSLFYLFYNASGLLTATKLITPFPATTSTLFASLGHMVISRSDDLIPNPFIFYGFATPSTPFPAYFGSAYGAKQGVGFVGFETVSEGRLNSGVFVTARQRITVNLDYTYSVFVGDEPHDAVTYPPGNPWLASGTTTLFVRLSQDLNTAIRRSNLINLTLYERTQEFNNSTPWLSAGPNTADITPHAIALDGTVTTGTPFTVNYQAPSPSSYLSLSASLWAEP